MHRLTRLIVSEPFVRRSERDVRRTFLWRNVRTYELGNGRPLPFLDRNSPDFDVSRPAGFIRIEKKRTSTYKNDEIYVEIT